MNTKVKHLIFMHRLIGLVNYMRLNNKLVGLMKRLTDEYIQAKSRFNFVVSNLNRELASSSERSNLNMVKKISEDLIQIHNILDIDNFKHRQKLLKIIGQMESRIEIKPIRPTHGDVFDPKIHDAVSGEGDVVRQMIRVGYLYRGNCIKPSVIILEES